jgi:hypothetical protein
MTDDSEFDYNNLTDLEKEVSELLVPFVTTLLIEDEQLTSLSIKFVAIADTVMAYDNQHARIMDIIQHSLVDYKDKPYKTYTLLFRKYKNPKLFPQLCMMN